MSDYGAYDNQPRRYKTTRTRPKGRDEPEYVEETTFIERGKGPPPRELAYRPRERERESSVETIERDFPPPSAAAARRARNYREDVEHPVRRARSAVGRRVEDDYDNYAGPVAAGAAGGYAAARARDGRNGRGQDRGGQDRQGQGGDGYDRRRQAREYYSDDESPPPRRHERRKSGLDQTLEALGLGGIAGAITGRQRSRSRGGKSDRRGGRDESRSRSRGGGDRTKRQWQQAAIAAGLAGITTAAKQMKEPGAWNDKDKLMRIATAAVAAGGIDKVIDRDPDRHNKRHVIEAVLGGLATNRLANGPTSNLGAADGRGRTRSRSRSVLDRFRSKSRRRNDSGSDTERGRGGGAGVKDLVAGGALAGVAKLVYDQVNGKNKKGRSPSNSSSDSYEASRRRDRNRDNVGRSNSQSRGTPSDETAVVGPRSRGKGRGSSENDSDKGSRSSSTDSESSADMEEKRKKLRGKEFLTAGLASIATIHAAHGVYQSMEASEKRHKLVQEGEMSPEEARKKRSKAWLQDAAAIGIAALGIKGAYSEWKEMNEQRHSVKELEERRRKRQKRREKRMKEAKENRGGGVGRGGSGGGGGGGYGNGGGGGGGGYAPYYPPPPPMGYR